MCARACVCGVIDPTRLGACAVIEPRLLTAEGRCTTQLVCGLCD